jgi:hypothetical protein
MVATCRNPDCKREIHDPKKGKLFLLPPPHESPELLWEMERLIDHSYWLCPACAQTHVVTLNGSKPVVSRQDCKPSQQRSSIA